MTEEETVGRFLAGHLHGMETEKLFLVLENLITWTMMAAYNFDEGAAEQACDVLCANAKEMIGAALVPSHSAVTQQ